MLLFSFLFPPSVLLICSLCSFCSVPSSVPSFSCSVVPLSPLVQSSVRSVPSVLFDPLFHYRWFSLFTLFSSLFPLFPLFCSIVCSLCFCSVRFSVPSVLSVQSSVPPVPSVLFHPLFLRFPSRSIICFLSPSVLFHYPWFSHLFPLFSLCSLYSLCSVHHLFPLKCFLCSVNALFPLFLFLFNPLCFVLFSVPSVPPCFCFPLASVLGILLCNACELGGKAGILCSFPSVPSGPFLQSVPFIPAFCSSGRVRPLWKAV